jgi:hypothetical protein
VRFLRSGGHGRTAATVVTAVLLLGGTAAAAGRVTAGLSQAGSVSVATFGPGPVATPLSANGYRLELRLTPNRATVAAGAVVALTRRQTPVNGARVRLTYTMPGMGAAGIVRVLRQSAPGRYADAGPILGMVGRWNLRIDAAPRRGAPFHVDLVDSIRA